MKHVGTKYFNCFLKAHRNSFSACYTYTWKGTCGPWIFCWEWWLIHKFSIQWYFENNLFIFFFINRSAFGKRHWMETGCVSVMWTKVRDKSQTVKGHCHSYQPQNYIQFSMFLLCFAMWRIRKTLWIMGNEESKSSTSSSTS